MEVPLKLERDEERWAWPLGGSQVCSLEAGSASLRGSSCWAFNCQMQLWRGAVLEKTLT